MGVYDAQIIFDEPTAIFMPGQIITGRVLVVTGKPVKINRVKMNFRGKCKISWFSWDRRYIGKERYLENKIILVCDKDESQLEVGKYNYPFNFFLPHNIPSTFACKYGYIRFMANVQVDISCRSTVKKEVMFEVISPINLNNVPSLSEPQKTIKEKSYRYSCFKSGSMKLEANIPYSGFVPGQTIPITVKLDNMINVDIDHIKIRLERKWNIDAPRDQSRKSDIAEKIISGATKHTSKTHVVQIEIPSSLMILNFEHCDVITDKFTLHVEACGHTKVSFIVTLGNIPLVTASDDHQHYHYFQLSNQKYSSKGPIPKISFPFVD